MALVYPVLDKTQPLQILANLIDFHKPLPPPQLRFCFPFYLKQNKTQKSFRATLYLIYQTTKYLFKQVKAALLHLGHCQPKHETISFQHSRIWTLLYVSYQIVPIIQGKLNYKETENPAKDVVKNDRTAKPLTNKEWLEK